MFMAQLLRMKTMNPIPRPNRKLILTAVLFSALATMPGCTKPELRQHRDSRPLMGTTVEIVTEGPDPARLEHATDAAYAEMTRLSDMMNHNNPQNLVSAINREAGKRPVAVAPELMYVLRMARTMSERSQGAFDVTVGSLTGWRFGPERPAMPSAAEIRAQLPLVDYRNLILDEANRSAYLAKPGMRIDLGGVAKLYIVHAGMGMLKRNGVVHAKIDAGGDVEVLGKFEGRLWRVGIRDARAPDRLFGIVELKYGFVVSSGDYERYFVKDGKRYHHILDPRTGYPTQGPRGVTLIGDDLDLVNGFSAAIMAMGEARGRALLEQYLNLEGVIFNRDGTVWVSPALVRNHKFERLDEAKPATVARD